MTITNRGEFLRNIAYRYFVMILGLFILALGIGFSAAAALGVSPVSSIPYVLSKALPITMGTLTVMMHALFLIAQIALLRKEFKAVQLLQLGVVVIFGFFTDFCIALTSRIQVDSYLTQWLLCILSCFVIGLGVAIEMKAGVATLPMEGLMKTVSQLSGKNFGKVKSIADTTLVVIGVACSLILFKELKGIREGTVFAAVFIGYIVKYISTKLSFLDKSLAYSNSFR
ncbi:MAG: DUF6198 family protein [Clostridiaceae bacterium]